jgi:DNA-directed RNA polymerase specialized sigma24 family protein
MQDVHRYRAERLARTNYTKLQAPVAHFVRRRLGRAAENLPDQELEASYNVAWDALMRQVTQDKAPDGIDGWLRVVTYRQALRHLRRRRFDCELPLGDHDDFETASDPCELANSREIVRQFLTQIRERFGERSARIVAHLWLGGFTRAAAADRVGVSQKRLENMLYGTRGRAGLKQELARLMDQLDSCADAHAPASGP